ncbi:MAG: histidine phosphatase family protein [Gallionellaceae bacterium]
MLIELVILVALVLVVVVMIRPPKAPKQTPPRRVQFTFIRHGESEANIGHFINDDPNKPVHLTEKGKVQAATLATTLIAENFTHAFVSEFPRAQETMAFLLKDRNIPLHIDARLNERKSGMDGQPVNAFNDQVLADPLRFKTPNGESFLEQMERVSSFVDDLVMQHPDARFLVVSHENPILAAQGLASTPEAVVLANLANCGRVDLYVATTNTDGNARRYFTSPN